MELLCFLEMVDGDLNGEIERFKFFLHLFRLVYLVLGLLEYTFSYFSRSSFISLELIRIFPSASYNPIVSSSVSDSMTFISEFIKAGDLDLFTLFRLIGL